MSESIKKKEVHELSPADIWGEIIMIQGGETDVSCEVRDDRTVALLRDWATKLCKWQKQISSADIEKYATTLEDASELCNNALLPVVLDIIGSRKK